MASCSEPVGRNDASHEPHPFGLFGVDHPPRQDHVHRLRFADEARQALGGAGARQDADGDLRLPEPGGLGREDEVAHQRQLAAAAERVARDGGDNRLAATGDALPRRRNEIGEIDVDERPVLHFLDVGASGKCLLVPGEHDRSNRIVGFEQVERRRQLAGQGVAQGIEDPRPVQGDHTHAAAHLDQDEGIGVTFDRFGCLHLNLSLHKKPRHGPLSGRARPRT